MTERRDVELRRQLAPENDWIVDLAIDYAERRLSPDRMAEFRDRLASDADFRAVAQPVLDATEAPPLSRPEFERYWNDFCRRAGLTPTPTRETGDLTEYNARVRARSMRLWQRVAIAAAIVIAIITIPMGTTFYLEHRDFNTVEAPKNVQLELRLPDDTRVTLAAGSTLRYRKEPSTSRERFVELKEGQARFDVAPTNRPFVLMTPHAEVRVTGTRFEVRLSYTETFLMVREGVVSVRWLNRRMQPDDDSRPVRAGEAVRIEWKGNAISSSRSIGSTFDTTSPPSTLRGTP